MSSALPTLAFFGATGGCTSNALALALKDGYHATALARTPSKLHNALLALGVSESTIEANLIVIPGNIKSVADVKTTIAPSPDRIAGIVMTGVGGTPHLTPSLWPVTLDDPHVCETTSKTIVAALEELRTEGAIQAENKPIVVFVSGTGISDRERDVPLPIYPLYHWLLHVPHVDKRAAEKILFDTVAAEKSPIKDIVVVRPSLLTNSEMAGLENIRVGWEWPRFDHQGKVKGNREEEPGPQIGYVIGRTDVGNWIFHEVLKGDEKWNGKCITLTN